MSHRQTIDLHPHRYDEDVREWLVQLGLPINDIPVDSKLVIHFDSNVLQWDEYERDETRQLQIDESGMAMKRRTMGRYFETPLPRWPFSTVGVVEEVSGL